MTTPAGWHDDPHGEAWLRWWDGSTWTEHIWNEPETGDDHPGAPAWASGPTGTAPDATDADHADEPHADEPHADEPHADEPHADEPSGEEPSADDATADDPPFTDLAGRPPGATAKEQARRARHRSFAAFLFDARSGERTWRAAARGEREVARRLRKLEPGWLVLHSVPLGEDRGDIDHLVIGPAGVFTLNTKNLLGSRVRADPLVVQVDGKETPYLRAAAHEGEHASQVLTRACGFDVPVTPVLVVMAHRLTVIEQPADVAVVGRRSIVSWLTAQPASQSFDVASEIFERARRDTTWR